MNVRVKVDPRLGVCLILALAVCQTSTAGAAPLLVFASLVVSMFVKR